MYIFVAYAIEIIVLKGQENQVSIGIFTTGFSLVGESAINTGIGYILMCIFFNIINVVMEEGVFRGLFVGIVSIDHTMKTAILFQSLLFGVWHIVTPLHNLIDGDLGIAGFIGFKYFHSYLFLLLFLNGTIKNKFVEKATLSKL